MGYILNIWCKINHMVDTHLVYTTRHVKYGWHGWMVGKGGWWMAGDGQSGALLYAGMKKVGRLLIPV